MVSSSAMRMRFWAGSAAAAALLMACRSKPEPSKPRADRAEEAPSVRTELERLRTQGGFTPDAYVVWSPIWPKRRDEVVVMYDLTAKHAPLAGAEQLSWILRPEQGPAIERQARRDSGIAVVRVPASELVPGRFSFRAGDRVDDACGNPPGLPIVDLVPRWQSAESEHFVYKWLDGDPVGKRVREVLVRLERRRKAVIGEARLSNAPHTITFLHYPDRESGLLYQAHHGNNFDWSRNLVFSSEAEDDSHELTHLLFFREVGRHSGLFDEGVAIHVGQELAVGSGWQDRPCDAWALDALADGTLPPLAKLLTPAEMYAPSWSVVGKVYYPAGCSFVRHLLERHGMPKLKQFLGSWDCEAQHDATRVAAAFERVFQVSLDDEDRAWRLALTRPPN
jgi:hypothetical protein